MAQEIVTIILTLSMLIITVVCLSKYYNERRYQVNEKGLQYMIGNTIDIDKVNLGFYNTLTKEVEWIYEVSYDYSKRKNDKYLPILIKKYYDRDGLILFTDINLYSSIAQVQLHNLLELEEYNTLLNDYKSS